MKIDIGRERYGREGRKRGRGKGGEEEGEEGGEGDRMRVSYLPLTFEQPLIMYSRVSN